MCEHISVPGNEEWYTNHAAKHVPLQTIRKSPLVDRAKENGLEQAIQHYEELTLTISDLVPSDEHAV